jgi:hypothetical protein
MISINLLKQTMHHHGAPGPRPRGALKVLIIAAVGIGIIIGGIEIMHRWLANPGLPAISWRKADTEPLDTAGSGEEAMATKTVSRALPDTVRRDSVKATALAGALPDTTHRDTVKAKAVASAKPDTMHHDIVRAKTPAVAGREEIGKNTVATVGSVVRGTSERKPVEPGPGERAAWDIAFSDKVFSALAAVIPDDIAFTDISIDSFSRLSIGGRSPSRESLGKLFSGLPKGTFDLAQPPRSFIAPDSESGYRFRLESRVVYARPIPADSVGPERIPFEVAGFSDLLKANNIVIHKGLSRIAADNAGEFRRIRYSLAGSGTLPDVVAFVRAAHEARLPCAFRKLRILASGKGGVAIDADVDFITRH